MPIFRLTRLHAVVAEYAERSSRGSSGRSYNGDRLCGSERRVTELARTTLIVRYAERDDQAYAVPSSGGEIVMDNPFFLADATITIAA